MAEDNAGNPTLKSIRKVEDFIRENGTEDDPVVVNQMFGEIGISFSNIRAAAEYLEEKDVVNSTESRKGTREYTAFYA